MGKRNFGIFTRFTAEENRAIQSTIKELGLDPKRARSEVVRFGTLFFCRIKPDSSPALEKYLRQLLKANIKAELIRLLGPEDGIFEKLKKFWKED